MSVLTTIKPNAIEQGYLNQGYELPAGWTWERVATIRSLYEIKTIFVPITRSDSGCAAAAWGVPFIDGKPLTHPDDEDATFEKKDNNYGLDYQHGTRTT